MLFGYWGERVCFQLPYNPATHTTMILVCVYKYTCSVMFVTHGNQGHGAACMCAAEEPRRGRPVVILFICIVTGTEWDEEKKESCWILKINLNTVFEVGVSIVSRTHTLCPFLARPHY